MALIPNDSIHALQIQAGILGRDAGHNFETYLTEEINNTKLPIKKIDIKSNLFYGSAANSLLQKALSFLNWKRCHRIEALALGTLATAEEGQDWLEVHDIKVKACKSDVLLTMYNNDLLLMETIGVSIKQCSKPTPTNAQLYYTTAKGFIDLLTRNQIPVSTKALNSLKQFCGEKGFSPSDNHVKESERKSDPRRYFWEEIDEEGRVELENIFTVYQDEITKLLLRKAYISDPFPPDLILHLTKKVYKNTEQEFAIYSVDELVSLSKKYRGFDKKKYSVKKGSYKDPKGIEHDAPRFGIVQMQRGGQAQHPEQLQFNLQAGYFYKI